MLLARLPQQYAKLTGRGLFGEAMKYPLFRLAHSPEWFLRRKLYLDFSDGRDPRFKTARHVPVPDERHRPGMSEGSLIPLDGLLHTAGGNGGLRHRMEGELRR